MSKELISKEIIFFNLAASTKEEVIVALSEGMENDNRLISKEGYITDVLKREEGSSTAIGFTVATPHSKSVHVKEPSLAFARLENKISWDGTEEVEMVFQIAVPSPGQGDRHLEILSTLFRKLVHDDFRNHLLKAETEAEVLECLGNL